MLGPKFHHKILPSAIEVDCLIALSMYGKQYRLYNRRSVVLLDYFTFTIVMFTLVLSCMLFTTQRDEEYIVNVICYKSSDMYIIWIHFRFFILKTQNEPLKPRLSP